MQCLWPHVGLIAPTTVRPPHASNNRDMHLGLRADLCRCMCAACAGSSISNSRNLHNRAAAAAAPPWLNSAPSSMARRLCPRVATCGAASASACAVCSSIVSPVRLRASSLSCPCVQLKLQRRKLRQHNSSRTIHGGMVDSCAIHQGGTQVCRQVGGDNGDSARHLRGRPGEWHAACVQGRQQRTRQLRQLRAASCSCSPPPHLPKRAML